MSQEPKVKRIYTQEGCQHCDEVKASLAAEGKLEEIEEVKCNINGTPEEIQNCIDASEKGVLLFPTLELEDGGLCAITGEDEEGNNICECGEPGKYPESIYEAIKLVREQQERDS